MTVQVGREEMRVEGSPTTSVNRGVTDTEPVTGNVRNEHEDVEGVARTTRSSK